VIIRLHDLFLAENVVKIWDLLIEVGFRMNEDVVLHNEKVRKKEVLML
jgi:hypothetical protein